MITIATRTFLPICIPSNGSIQADKPDQKSCNVKLPVILHISIYDILNLHARVLIKIMKSFRESNALRDNFRKKRSPFHEI